ncbi:MAG: sigma-54-dependent Fis family transcriptional regulator [Desulfobacterium sp.]|nr:sigma-54-dependent Fis family transcriptional regulator [Desulfobacterium sp.]
MEKILIVDDEKNYPTILGEVLKEEGFEPVTAASSLMALDILKDQRIDLVLTDVNMPGMDGIELMKKIKEITPDMPVIVMTAYGSVEKAVEAMHKGAYTYILKPFENETLVAHISKAISIHGIVQENTILRNAVSAAYNFGNIIGKSKPMHELYETIKKVAPTNASILIEGESGTGKELVARSIHFNSPRKGKPLVAVNCSAFAESLLESELFGHEKGSFTGAGAMRKGRFEMADRGTLFLDEIGELPMNLQVKLLRVVQEKTFERVGGSTPLTVDFRLIAATNKNLEQEVENGNFREDLYYRLNVVKAVIPPLRDRQEDIPLLINHFIEKYSNERKSTEPVTGVSQEAAQLFFDHAWPGNVRELENTIERAVILSSKERITPADLPLKMRETISAPLQLDGIPENAGLSETLAAVEKRMIQRAMMLTGNVQTRAAKLLGIGKSGLNQKLKKYKL